MASATATAGAVPVPRPAEEAIDKRKLIAFLGMVFGMFMAILDIQIVSASLSEIQAGLGASADEIPWVQTAYLIAEVIMIPLSGFLSRVISTRWMFAISAGGFTVMSFLCGTATSIDQMIVYRALQGFIGGGMIPTVFASAFTIFPRSKQPIVSPLIGLVATLAPTIGPTVGGYLTQLLSWHWLFFINVGPGIVVTLMAVSMIDFDEPDLALFDHFDWWGLISMGTFLGSLEYVLEEGPTNDWFDDQAVLVMAIASAVGAVVFFWRAFTVKEPIVDLRAFKDRNFATGSLFSFVMGIGLYGLTYLFPVYLGRVRGYDSLMIGETMFVTGLCMFFTAPIAGNLMRILDPRVMLFAGFVGFGAGTWIMSGITHDWDFWEILVPQVLRGVSLMTCMVPITNIALGTLPPQRIKNASGLFNLTRNLGGAVGLAVINTVLNHRDDLHLQRLRESVHWGSETALETLDNIRQGLSTFGASAEAMATSQMVGMLRREALVMSFADVFLILTMLFVSLGFGAFLVRRPQMAGGGGGGGH
ncbi:DHA2 family efflux MFS transporter permease subunit [Labrys wisconsinensis]|uniref:DHA2 family multidrug resistance protein n=1 Tax=Labrys wisconsinensis TaxID=425677 RepID=A0ABU0J1Q2_9HYPH|nr:DHA2 family efflux MFS transporter permease subunit [Labrys wisconsinensis]MDQ0467565.1 DHA2 family multidrug resistance protein [Labrys wisconsinensis]